MVFTSGTYLLFLAAVFACYWLLGSRKSQNLLLLAAGYAFYAWWDYRYCSLMLLSTFVDFACGRGCRNSAVPRLFLVISLICNLGLLGVFKYFNFFQDSLIVAFHGMGVELDPFVLQLALPVGISFYTFQTLSYTIDIYRGKLDPHDSLLDYAAYVSFFPQLVAGPIERATSLLPQFARPRIFDAVEARDGLRQMLWGFFKKLAIADRFAIVVDEVYARPEAFPSTYLWIAAIGFSFQIYCDFSAYSDIAIGTARLFGFQLTRNFAMPYFSQDFVEFWRRWHITLSTWFRDYVYIPLGGSRRGVALTRWNILIVFGLSGLWHGAGWNFVLWGLLHGCLVIVSSSLRRESLTASDLPLGSGIGLTPLLRAMAVFVVACLVWVFFRVTGFDDAIQVLSRMTFAWESSGASLQSIGSLNVGFKLLPFMLALEFVGRRFPHPLMLIERFPKPVRWAIYLGLVWVTLYYMPEETGEFVYFQF